MKPGFLIIALFFVAFFANWSNMALHPFLPAIAEEFDSSVSVIGQAVTISLVGGAIIGLIAGPLADRYGQRRFLFIGLVVMSICGAVTALASGFAMLLIARFMAGVAGGMIAGIGMSVATTRLHGDQRRSTLGWIVTGGALGAVVGLPMMTTIAGLGTWRIGFWVLSGIPILLMIGCYFGIAADTALSQKRFGGFNMLTGYRDLMGDRRSRLLQSGTHLWAIPWVAGSGYLGAYLIQAHGFSIAEAGYGYMWGAAWYMVGSRLGIRLLTYFELYTLIVVASLLLAVTTALLFWFPFGMPWILIVLLAWPLNAGIGVPLINSAISEAATVGQSTAMMARQFSWTTGGAVGVALGGLLIVTSGYALFGIVTGASALAVAVLVVMADRANPYATEQPAEVSMEPS